MALPQQLTSQQIQEMLNVAAPSAGIAAPQLSSMQGSSIGYIDRPSYGSPYSPENLPPFMADFQQISPTLFAPNQGVFAQAPTVDSIQPQMPQQYIDEYADLERAFQESIAIDPTQFGDIYRGGLFMPMQTIEGGAPQDQFDIAQSLAAVAGLKELYPYAKEAVQKVYDPVEEFVQQKALDPVEDAFKVVADPTEEFVQQILLDPAEDVAKIPLKEVEKLLPEVDVNIDYKTISEILSDEPAPVAAPAEDAKTLDYKDGKLDVNITLPEFTAPEKLKEILDKISSGAGDVGKVAGVVGDAYGNLENLIENPSGDVAEKAIQSINAAYDIASKNTEIEKVGSEVIDSGETGRIIPPAAADTLITVADSIAIANALENPSAKNLTNAYSAADNLVERFGADGMGLPAGESIGSIGQVLTGLEALEGGIESPAEAINVVNAANLVSGFASNLMAGQGAATAASGAAAAGFVPESFTNFLGPVGTIAGIVGGLKAVSSLAKGGAAGEYPRVVGDFEVEGGRLKAGANVDAADVSEGGDAGRVNQNWAQQTFDSGAQMTNDLIDNYGFQLDESKAGNLLKIQSSSYYNKEGELPMNAPDLVVKLIQSGALKPTENTPQEILTSNEAFGSFLEGRLAKGQDEYAAKIYDMTNKIAQTGESDGYKNPTAYFGGEYVGAEGRTVGPKTFSKAKFAAKESAEDWVNKQTPEQIFYQSGSGNNRQYFVKKPSYSIKETKVNDKTFYEIDRSENIQKIGGKSDNMSDLKLKYADKYKTQEEAQKLIQGLDKEEKFTRKQTGKYPRYYVETPVYSVVQSTQNGQPVYSVNKTYSSKQIGGNSLADAKQKYIAQTPAGIEKARIEKEAQQEAAMAHLPDWLRGLNLGSFNLSGL